jgi:hypothetical protein
MQGGLIVAGGAVDLDHASSNGVTTMIAMVLITIKNFLVRKNRFNFFMFLAFRIDG